MDYENGKSLQPSGAYRATSVFDRSSGYRLPTSPFVEQPCRSAHILSVAHSVRDAVPSRLVTKILLRDTNTGSKKVKGTRSQGDRRGHRNGSGS